MCWHSSLSLQRHRRRRITQSCCSGIWLVVTCLSYHYCCLHAAVVSWCLVLGDGMWLPSNKAHISYMRVCTLTRGHLEVRTFIVAPVKSRVSHPHKQPRHWQQHSQHGGVYPHLGCCIVMCDQPMAAMSYWHTHAVMHCVGQCLSLREKGDCLSKFRGRVKGAVNGRGGGDGRRDYVGGGHARLPWVNLA
jgi:hypothetical protein